MKPSLAVLAFSILASACDATDTNTAPSTEVEPNPRVDTDITPPSGTGGETQAARPDGTTSDAQKPAPNQPTPTD